MNKRFVKSLLLTASLAAAPVLFADEVIEQIDLGVQAYKGGELRQAVQELQYAVAQIQEVLNAQYTKLMPEPLAGWMADEPEAQSAGVAVMGGGTQVSRQYRKEDTRESVKIQLMADSPFLQAMSMMLSNPMMIQSDPSTKLYRLGKYRGMIKHQKGSKRWEISLMVANRILVQVFGDGLDSKVPAETYLEALDLKAVEKAFST